MDTQTAAPSAAPRAEGARSPKPRGGDAHCCPLRSGDLDLPAWVREALWSSGIGPRPRALPPLRRATTDFLPPSFPTTSCHRAKVKRPTHREPFPKHLRVPGSTPEVQTRRGDGRGSEAQAPRSRDILWFCSLAAPGTQEALSLEGMVLTARFLKSGLKRCLHNSSVTTVMEACRPRLPHLTSWRSISQTSSEPSFYRWEHPGPGDSPGSCVLSRLSEGGPLCTPSPTLPGSLVSIVQVSVKGHFLWEAFPDQPPSPASPSTHPVLRLSPLLHCESLRTGSVGTLSLLIYL